MAQNFDDLEPAIKSFRGEGPIVVNDDKIRAYLSDTANTGLELGIRLTVLAIELQSDEFADGWKEYSRIFEYALLQNPDDARVSGVWQVEALDWLDKSHSLDLDERLLVFRDAEALHLNYIDRHGKNSGAAFLLGLVYYRHPLRTEEILVQALQWFRTSLELACSDDDNAGVPGSVTAKLLPTQHLYIGHCLFELGDIAAALEAYEAVDEDVLSETADDESLRSLHERLASCRKK